MEPIGSRIKTIRDALRVTQPRLKEMTGVNQPRLSKIESGKERPSPDIIDKIAKAFGRSGLDLVNGTDVEGYYRAQRLTPEEQQASDRTRRLENAARIMALHIIYLRIVGLFEALYGGGIVPSFVGEELYLQLRKQCQQLLTDIRSLHPQLSEEAIYFPDHFECEGPDDDLLMAFNDWFAPEMKKSLRAILEVKIEYSDILTSDLENEMVKAMNFGKLDEQIEDMRQHRMRVEQRIYKTVELEAQRLRDQERIPEALDTK